MASLRKLQKRPAKGNRPNFVTGVCTGHTEIQMNIRRCVQRKMVEGTEVREDKRARRRGAARRGGARRGATTAA